MPDRKKPGRAASQQPARITEQRNPGSAGLDTKSTLEILRIINREDRLVAGAVSRVIPEIARAVDLAVEALTRGGRLVYLGAGTSGRLGVLDAAECIPTFGTEQVVAVMAGAPRSMFRPSEVSEDDPQLGERDLRKIKLSRKDVLVGISASGRTPYVLGGLRYARLLGAATALLTANPAAEGRRVANVLIAPVVGPEVIAGSTRMKAGTAQKLVLNMLSTATMVRLGRVFSNLMIGVQLTNSKLRKRALGILMDSTGAGAGRARKALGDAGNSLPVALLMLAKGMPSSEAVALLQTHSGPAEVLRHALQSDYVGRARARLVRKEAPSRL
ncbi:MAG TPA: N-acetylmuramic acid 6-phosphate etherase [Terriglobia bacterium]|nr:N-acetylmuramic acid 6-phosphate etherase [Terriglobia bacterium]